MDEQFRDCTDCKYLAIGFMFSCVATPSERPRPREYKWCRKRHNASHPYCPDYKKKGGLGYE